jgi:hypothetical protein
MREKITVPQKFGTLDEFIEDRRHVGNNVEQAEAYIHELSGRVAQLVYTAENQFSDDAIFSFPRFPGGAACDIRACAFWICAFSRWIARLSPKEGRTLATVKFFWN